MRYFTLGAAAVAVMAVLGAEQASAQRDSVYVRRRVDDTRGWLGISFRTTNENGRESVVVDRVLPGSPAQRAGVAVGDTVVRLNGAAASDDAVTEMRTTLHPGESVRLRVRHGAGEVERTVVAAARPGQDVTITNGVIRIAGDDSGEPVIIRLDSVGAIADRHVRILLDSLGLRTRLPQMLEREARVIRIMGDSLRGPAMEFRVHMDSMRHHLDSLAFRMDTLRTRLRRMHPGPDENVEVIISRDGEVHSGRAIRRGDVLRRESEVRGAMPFFLDVGRRALGGAEMVDLDERLGSYFGTRQGALVVKVSPRTPAARAGLEAGDVVTRVGDRAVGSVAELRSAFGRGGDGQVRLQVIRHGRRRDLQMQWERGSVETVTGPGTRERVEIRTREQ